MPPPRTTQLRAAQRAGSSLHMRGWPALDSGAHVRAGADSAWEVVGGLEAASARISPRTLRADVAGRRVDFLPSRRPAV